ncbi:hypothetical protein H4219_002447 [Mycoemilia scoparia]|uniref:Transcription factor TFIIIC triple barrel domain-containing protein n=1 Tax=Mycoemilia scoparia TaxID=417184 RepID=A0A9W8DUE6_9FUNG|nr:hypothetical protein H4219_002447 [Mycoemilia scoparia]
MSQNSTDKQMGQLRRKRSISQTRSQGSPRDGSDTLRSTSDTPGTCNVRDESESEYEEETVYVVANLGKDGLGFVNRLTSVDKVALTGVDTDTPFLQLGGNTFQGHHDESLGTQVILEPMTDGEEGKSDAKLLAITTKVIRFDQVELTRKSSGPLDTIPEAGSREAGSASYDNKASTSG